MRATNGLRKALGRAGLVAFAAATWTLGVSAGGARAGAVFLAGKLDGESFVPDEKVKGPCFTVRYSTTTVEIEGAHARTKIEETVAGSTKGAAGFICIVPLPEGAADGSVRVGENADAETLSTEEAQALLEELARATGSAKLLSLTGGPMLVVRDLPPSTFEDRVKVVLTYDARAEADDGLYTFECPMPAVGLAAGPVSRLAVTVNIRNDLPLRAVICPTHETVVERDGLREATVRASADDWAEGGGFTLQYVADADPLGLRVIAHRGTDDTDEEDGYFMLIGNPTGSAKGDAAIEKDVVFVLDTSGSMRGEKIEQARAAVEYCLENLKPRDRFNIVTFGTKVSSFRDGLVKATRRNRAAAAGFVDEVRAYGRTNIGEALARGLAGTSKKGRPRIMIFLTDGTPTAGELVPENIVKALPEMNASRTQIFVMGLGHDVNAHLLDRLAEETDGSSEYVDTEEEGEEIDVKMAALYDRLSNPVLVGATVDFGGLATHSVYPKRITALFKGTDVSVTGRYRAGGTHTVTISGELAGRPVSYTRVATFPEAKAPEHEHVATLWAARKIGFLLQEIRLHGENKELVEEVVRLSRRFGIVTEYTAFLASAGEDMSDEKAAAEATRRMSVANAMKSGKWAFNQARNDRQLQQRAVANQGDNFYVDRRGKKQRLDNIRQVGRRVFYLRDGQWVDAEEAGERKTREVKLFSKEYFELIRKDEGFARAQSVSPSLSVNVGNERIVVKK